MGDFKFAVSPGAFGVYDPFGDAFTIKVCEEVDEMEVLQEKGPIGANPLRSFGIEDWAAIGSGVDGSVLILGVNHRLNPVDVVGILLILNHDRV